MKIWEKYRNRDPRLSKEDLEAIGLELRAGIRNQLDALASYINVRTSITPSVESIPDRGFLRQRRRILLTIGVGEKRDVRKLKSMAKLFVDGYLANHKNTDWSVRIFVTLR